MQSQCRIRSRESGMWGVGVGGGGWQKVKEQKKKVNIRGKVGGIRCDGLLCIYVHLCCAHTLRPKLECMLLSARKKIMEKQ